MKIPLISITVMCLLYPALMAQTINGEHMTHTFSIVARDARTGEIGVAVQSHWFSVGSIVSWAEAGVGAVATQSLVNVSYGQCGLDLLREGKTPQEVLKQLLDPDEGKAFRQVAVLDVNGRVAAYTGDKCIADAGHHTGENYSVQANMMLNKEVVPAMAQAFENSTGLLAERLVEALRAAQKAGGDIRGQQSAALLVVRGESVGEIWNDRLIDLRVEDHPQAVEELARVLQVFRAYKHMNNGDLAIEHNDEETALREYGAAQKMFPENLEMKFWTAVSLANIGNVDQALPQFREVFRKDPNWIELTRRIVPNGMLTVDSQVLEQILKAAEDR